MTTRPVVANLPSFEQFIRGTFLERVRYDGKWTTSLVMGSTNVLKRFRSMKYHEMLTGESAEAYNVFFCSDDWEMLVPVVIGLDENSSPKNCNYTMGIGNMKYESIYVHSLDV